jgi:hypothetical protein
MADNGAADPRRRRPRDAMEGGYARLRLTVPLQVVSVMLRAAESLRSLIQLLSSAMPLPFLRTPLT